MDTMESGWRLPHGQAVVSLSRLCFWLVKGDVLEYTRTYHQLEMIEVLFHTITHHKKYNIYLPRQFETINFNPQGYVNWNCNDVLTTHSDMWYHPIKTQTKFLSDCNLTDSPSN